MAANGDPVARDLHAHASAMAAEPDELVERDPHSRWLPDLQRPGRCRRRAVRARGVNRVVLGVAADGMRADPAHGHLRAGTRYGCAGPPSTLHTMSAIPDGLPPAVALTYCVPAVDGASTGPDNESVGMLLSM